MNIESYLIAFRRHSSIIVISILVWGLSLMGCGYPEVSPKTYDFAKALYSVTNLKQPDRLNDLDLMIKEAKSSGEISFREAEYLGDVIELGRAGDWEEAQREVRELLEDQVKTF